MLFDVKLLKTTIDQIEEEKKIPAAVLWDAIEQSLAAAYKKDHGKRGQVIRCQFDQDTGSVTFTQVKTVVDEDSVRPALSEEDMEKLRANPELRDMEKADEEVKPRYDEEKHMFLDAAKLFKANAAIGDEIIFPLETPETDFGRVAAQTAKQVIMQKIREAERGSVMNEYEGKQGEIIIGSVQKVDRGMVFIDFNRATGVLPRSEQIPGEFYKTGDRIKAYLYQVEEGPKGINLRLSRTHPRFIEGLFAVESPEVAAGTVEIKSIAREAGARSKIAVWSNDDNVDAQGACIGQRGVRVRSITEELHGEQIDIIPFSADSSEYVSNALAPARVLDISINEETHQANVTVADDQLSLAIGKGGQNVRLAAKLTGWKIDIKGIKGEEVNEEGAPLDDEGFKSISDFVQNEAELTKDSTEEAAAPAETEAPEAPAAE
ncbi:MAG: nusA [Patescibacteria group bacterium]|nr:nusA [Patescibacteria group bacterium]